MRPGQLFYEGIRQHQAGECFLEHRGGCDGRLQAHHIYPKRILKALATRHDADAGEMEADWRNGMLLCRRHHHRVEHGFELFDRLDMPCVLEHFERDYPFVEAFWPRIYQRGRDVAETGFEGVIP